MQIEASGFEYRRMEGDVQDALVGRPLDSGSTVVLGGSQTLHAEILLGKGTFSRVVLVRDTATLKPFVLKAVAHSRLARAECAALTRLAVSPWHVGLCGTFQDPQFVYALLEYEPGGDLYSLLYEDSVSLAGFERRFVGSLVLGLEHARSRRVAWRDLKPENILVNHAGYLKMADFGSAKVYAGAIHRTFTMAGTAEYLAPEVVNGEGHDTAVDLWALGVVAFELHFASHPFAGATRADVFENILHASQILANDDIWPDTQPRPFVLELLQSHPAFRLGNLAGERQIQDHAWFTSAKCDEDWWRRLREHRLPRMNDALLADRRAPVATSRRRRIMTDGSTARTIRRRASPEAGGRPRPPFLEDDLFVSTTNIGQGGDGGTEPEY